MGEARVVTCSLLGRGDTLRLFRGENVVMPPRGKGHGFEYRKALIAFGRDVKGMPGSPSGPQELMMSVAPAWIRYSV